MRTDAAVAQGEKCEGLFKEFTQKAAEQFGAEGEELFQIGPQKDPVRIYEKAGDDYRGAPWFRSGRRVDGFAILPAGGFASVAKDIVYFLASISCELP